MKIPDFSKTQKEHKPMKRRAFLLGGLVLMGGGSALAVKKSHRSTEI